MRPSKKQLLINEVMKVSPSSDEKTLNRMTIHSIQVLLSTLNGQETKPMNEVVGVVDKKLTRKKRRKERVLEEETETIDANDYIETTVGDMVEEEEEEEEEEEVEEVEELEEEVIEKPKPVKQKKPNAKSKRGRPPKQNLEIDLKPHKTVPSKKMNDDKANIKEILTDFRKEITKLIQQYKRIKTKTDDHKEQLKGIYNDLYDKTAKMIEDEISKSYFPDDSLYDYSDKMLTSEKMRIQKILQ
jgi:hypothetical protein